MINPVYQSGNKTYGVNQYAVDTESEVSNLPTYCEMGSSALIIETGARYILNSQKQWVKQPVGTGSGGGGSSSGSNDDIVILETGDPSADPNNDDIVILG